MAHIRSFNYYTVGKQEGCLCDRCDQYITNICAVEFDNGYNAHIGKKCFEILLKESNLTEFGVKQFKKAMKSIKEHNEAIKVWETITEEEARSRVDARMYFGFYADGSDGWHNQMSFEEYRQRMISGYTSRLNGDDQKELARFKNVKFNTEQEEA